MDTLRDYIAYARSQCKPKLSEEAASTLIDGYVDMRRQGVSRKVTRSLIKMLGCNEVPAVTCQLCAASRCSDD